MRTQHDCLKEGNLSEFFNMEAERENLAAELPKLKDPALKAELKGLTDANLALLAELRSEVQLEVRKLEQIKDKLAPYGSEAHEVSQSFWA